MLDMKLTRATEQDFERITSFYRHVIDEMTDMDVYGKWIYGLHPTDDMIRGYIESGFLYYGEADGTMLSVLAVTPQGESYHDISWQKDFDDNDVAVIHLFCVDPGFQGQGVARQTMEMVIEQSRKEGKNAVRLDAIPCNIPALHLYESLGFQKRDQRLWHADNLGWHDFYLYELIL